MNSPFNFGQLGRLLAQGKEDEARAFLTDWAKTPMTSAKAKKKPSLLDAIMTHAKVTAKINQEHLKLLRDANTALNFIAKEERKLDDRKRLDALKKKMSGASSKKHT